MKKIKKVSVLAAALCVCMVICGPVSQAKTGSFSSVTSDSIQEKEKQIESAKKEKSQLQSGLTNVQNLKKKLENQKSDLTKYVAELDANMAVIEQNILDLEEKIVFKEAEIKVAEDEVTIAKANEQAQKDSMVVRTRLVYESGKTQLVDMLKKTANFGDFLNRADYVERVYEYDRRVLDQYIIAREYVELCEEQLELEKEILDETKAGVEAEKQALAELIEQKEQDILAYETDIKNQEQAIKEYQAEIKAQESEIASLEALINAEKKKILEQNGVVLNYDGGKFTFPLASYTRVSDDYGDRIHPTLKVQQFHNGVDFAAPKGTAIYAAYDGVVVAATYSATMGNYVMIDHGSGLYTIYMHASKLCVSKDDIVIHGEKIAEVGSTGRSTGNHLHFSVRLNGAYTSPWNYISK